MFGGDVPKIEDELPKLNMHKSISIICELISARRYNLKPIKMFGLEILLSFEMVLKRMLLPNRAKTKEEFLRDAYYHKNRHIVSIQMLLLLLKAIIKYGDYGSLTDNSYAIETEDYNTIIKLQLALAEQYNKGFEDKSVDMNHFVYANYHTNFERNVASAYLRSYYMFAILNLTTADTDGIEKEHRDYWGNFQTKYGYTIEQYLNLLFWELSAYYPQHQLLTSHSGWREVKSIYGNTAMKHIGEKVVADLSLPVSEYREWAKETEGRMWDFSAFNSTPLFRNPNGEYIVISDYALSNAFFEKLFWMVRDCYPPEDSRAMAYYGRLFERYVQELTKAALLGVPGADYIDEFEYGRENKKSSDAYIRYNDKLIIVECKGYSILLDSLIVGEGIEKSNRKVFKTPIIQADRVFSEIEALGCHFDGITTTYIISVTLDSVNAVPQYLQDIYTEIETEKCSEKTKYIYNLNIEEYERLMFLAEQNYDVIDILEKYFDGKTIAPFSTYLNTVVDDKIQLTKFMDEIYKRATAKMKDMYEPVQ